MTEPSTGWLGETLPQDVFGGKAAALSHATRAGLPVPAGFAVSTGMVERISAGPSAGDRDAVVALLDRLGAGDPLAIRSSALREDGLQASFAGQHDSILGPVGLEPVLAAIRQVSESARSPGAIAYRRRLGVAVDPLAAAVVQRLIPADAAGVLFTRDPVSRSEGCFIVEASWGLGESVVAGLVTPDSFRVTRDGEVLAQTTGAKTMAVRLDAAGGTTEVPITDTALVHGPCLDSVALRRLAALGRACEELFGPGQDVEWALAAGEVFLLQSRPITSTGARA